MTHLAFTDICIMRIATYSLDVMESVLAWACLLAWGSFNLEMKSYLSSTSQDSLLFSRYFLPHRPKHFH